MGCLLFGWETLMLARQMVDDRGWWLMIVYPLASLCEGCIDSFVGNACVLSVKWDGRTSKDVVGVVKQAAE